MPNLLSQENRKWAEKQIAAYKKVYPLYSEYAKIIQILLNKMVEKYAPESIIQTRPKSISSFAEKIWRKKNDSPDPVNQFTDLCGGRVIVHTQKEVRTISRFIEENFEIDWENSVDVSQRLKPTEFGYRSIHYIVQFKPGVFPQKGFEVDIPDEIFDLKAEIQVRTFFEHAWADLSHLMLYKKSYPAPEKWQRELAALAALLEEADILTSRIEKGLWIYNTSYGEYLTKNQTDYEIATLENVLEYDPHNEEIASQIGRLAISKGDWKKAINILSHFNDSEDPELLKNLGTALIKYYRKNPESSEYKDGQKYLKAALELAPDDPEPLSSLAGSYKEIDDQKAKKLYSMAFELDPTHPYSLNNYLDYEINENRNLSLIKPIKTIIKTSIKRTQELADVGVDIPCAYYNLGKFYLLLGDPYNSLKYYTKAIQTSQHSWMIETSLRSLEMLKPVKEDIKGFDWIYKMLLLGLAVKFSKKSAGDKLKKQSQTNLQINEPVVIVAGGTDRKVENLIRKYEELLLESFKEFKGTIISGGTISGISGLVGKVQEEIPELSTIGYLPELISARTSLDKRYKDLRYSEGSGFSPLEPLNYWIDLITSGIKPENVKLLGINGGKIDATEFRIALALGANVGIIKDSGREATIIGKDPEWKDVKNLFLLPKDTMTVKAFIGSRTAKFNDELKEKLAQNIHKNYCKNQLQKLQKEETSLKNWDELPETLKNSNREQVDHILEKLAYINYSIRKTEKKDFDVVEFEPEEIEKLAEMEHGRWNTERLLDGWKWGPKKDVESKISPYIVPWDELPEEIKKYDRDAVSELPELLAEFGYQIFKL